MKAHKPRSRSRSAARHKVLTLMQDGLGWLRGYPTGPAEDGQLPWMIHPAAGSGKAPERTSVDGTVLSGAVYCRNKLLRKFPRALPRVVGDRDAWYEQISQRIDPVKAIVNHGEPLPSLRERLDTLDLGAHDKAAALAVVRKHPDLEETMLQVAWIHGGTDSLAPALAFLVETADDLWRVRQETSGRRRSQFLLALVDLALTDDGGIARRIAQTLGRPIVFDRPLETVAQRYRGYGGSDSKAPFYRSVQVVLRGETDAPRRPVWPQVPGDRLGPNLISCLLELAGLRKGGWERGVRWLDLLIPDSLLDEWERYWERVDTLCQRADRLFPVRSDFNLPEFDDRRRRLVADFEKLETRKTEQPPLFFITDVMRLIVQEAQLHREHRRWHARADRTLPLLPHHLAFAGEKRRARPLAPRSDFFMLWPWLNEKYQDPRLSRLITLTADFLSDPATRPRRLWLWAEAFEPRTKWSDNFLWSLEALLLGGDLGRASEKDVFQMLEGAASSSRVIESFVETGDLDVASDLLKVTGNGTVAGRVLVQLANREALDLAEKSSQRVLAAAVRLAAGDEVELDRLLRVFTDRSLADDDADAFCKIAPIEWLRSLAVDLISHNELALAIRIAVAAHALGAINDRSAQQLLKSAPEVVDAPELDWRSRYPEVLHPPLQELARLDSNPARAAERVLSADFPAPDHLRRQVSTLRARIPDAAEERRIELEKRVAKLERLLAGPPPVLSPERLAHLRGKLEMRVCRLRAALLLDRLQHRLRRALSTQPDATSHRSWIDDERARRLLPPILRLEDKYRDLAFRLLDTAIGSEPRDLRDHPANRAFIERMEAQGVRMSPWLDEDDGLKNQFPDGPEVVLALERDPLEALRMGEPFETCLSPGHGNFFSAVLNVADVNKQIVYARTSTGQIVGRCLLALTREGRILTFYPYTHHSQKAFKEMAGAYVIQLAERMHTTTINRGYVDELMATGWYDDGPVDVTGRFAFLAHGSTFRNRLPVIDPECFRPQLLELLAPDVVDAVTLPLVLSLDELEERPALVLPLLEDIRRIESLAPLYRLRVARLARRAGSLDTANRYLGQLSRSPKALRALGHYEATELARELIELGDPSAALRVLRNSRSRGVREWDDEEGYGRLTIAARAFKALNRPGQARRLWELAKMRESY